MDMIGLYVKDMSEIAKKMVADIKHLDECSSIMAIAMYDDIKELLKQLLLYKGIKVANIDLHEYGIKNYNKEFYLELDSNLEISVEPAYYEGKGLYLKYDAPIVYVGMDCNTAALKKNIHEDHVIIYSFEFIDTKDCKHNHDDKEDNSVNRQDKEQIAKNDKKKEVKEKYESYFVNGKKVDEKVYKETIGDIEKYFTDWDNHFTEAMQDSILSLCRFRDMHNQFLADFHRYLL